MANSISIGSAYLDQKISGGVIDNSVIGGTTAAAGTFTTLTATGAFGANGKTAVSAAATVAALSTLCLQSGFGFSTSAGFVTAITAINSILTCLKNSGFMAE